MLTMREPPYAPSLICAKPRNGDFAALNEIGAIFIDPSDLWAFWHAHCCSRRRLPGSTTMTLIQPNACRRRLLLGIALLAIPMMLPPLTIAQPGSTLTIAMTAVDLPIDIGHPDQ